MKARRTYSPAQNDELAAIFTAHNREQKKGVLVSFKRAREMYLSGNWEIWKKGVIVSVLSPEKIKALRSKLDEHNKINQKPKN